MRIFLIILLSFQFFTFSCNTSSHQPYNRFEAEFNPSFSEHSLIKFYRIRDIPKLEILIKNNFRVDPLEDTFYHKQTTLRENEATYFDSLTTNWPTPWTPHAKGVLDGMNVTYTKISERDTSLIELRSPSFRNDSLGYRLTLETLDVVALCFRDSLIDDYFKEIKTYMNVDTTVSNANRQALFNQREIKYGWKSR